MRCPARPITIHGDYHAPLSYARLSCSQPNRRPLLHQFLSSLSPPIPPTTTSLPTRPRTRRPRRAPKPRLQPLLRRPPSPSRTPTTLRRRRIHPPTPRRLETLITPRPLARQRPRRRRRQIPLSRSHKRRRSRLRPGPSGPPPGAQALRRRGLRGLRWTIP